ncbi:hypothetical protein F2P81_018534 [Scophthalmus maximus]|uniref:Uncharacterized protein n=1 Tax=Scophthalmus maximus TaxID=52904 RepID=A0A6A4SA23_SCOMX|nr:hypothetical protein F2P81_018534 [Scophthalmus maximus]
MILLPGLLFILWGEAGRCRADDGGFTFDGDIHHFAVATNTVYVATDERLYQLSQDLTPVRSVTQRGVLQAGKVHFYRVNETSWWNATFRVNVLLPVVEDGVVISCGVTSDECGHCEVLELTDISSLRYSESIQLGPLRRSSASVAVLVKVQKSPTESDTYIMTAIQKQQAASNKCASDCQTVNLQDADGRHIGGIFSLIDDQSTPSIKSRVDVGFVDGFQVGSTIYLLANVGGENNTIRLIWLEGEKSKTHTLHSLRGATLRVSGAAGGGHTLLASSVIPGTQPVLWSGVFSEDAGRTNTELLVFDISADLTGGTKDADPDFFSIGMSKFETPKTLRPKAVLFRQSIMTSVLATRQKAWLVFFIGTADGLLIKLAVDKHYHTSCPTVLYRANDDRPVFPKLLLDQVDLKHVYVPLRDQMRRVPVAKCSIYTNVRECWSAEDPYCIWCGSKRSCTFEDDCGDSDWVSIADDYQEKMVSYRVAKASTGQITLHIQTHLTAGHRAQSNFACQFSARSSVLCSLNGLAPQFPQCTCTLTNGTLPAEGQPESQCENQTGNDTVVGTSDANRLLLPRWSADFSPRPEISSITPSIVSFYGRNHVVLSGRNLGDVAGVRMQAHADCTPRDGKRKLTLMGSHLDFVEGVTHSHAPQEVRLPENKNYQNLTYDTLAAENTQGTFTNTVFLKVANESLPCSTNITYYPEPEFSGFKSITAGGGVRITIEKKADKLEMTTAELSVWGVNRGIHYPCVMKIKETHNESDIFTCEIQSTEDVEFQKLMIKYGDKTVMLHLKSSLPFLWVLLVLLLIPCIIFTVAIVYRSKQKKLTAQMNRRMENLELDIRNDIRQGFVDLQTEKADLMENIGAIPFLDYKHFASRIFFPEDTVKIQLDECCHGMSRLIQDQHFLTSMVHALEEQKSFTIKDKCALASLLTVALHSNLSYLTETMEVLLKDLMQQKSNTLPKLLLRRTESTVEKLLTNWMSICLYGFLRESVGQHLFLMVSTLTQQIRKGPVDCVTEKALYTLSEDWLLWQAQDFSTLKLKVLFAVGSYGEVSEPLEVSSLSCDTVEQVKEKILSTFKAKFGFPFNAPIRDVRIEFEKDGSFVPLEEVDRSSQVVGEVMQLNTLKHYKVPDGATIKVLSKKIHPPLSPQGSVKDDENFSGKYFHLIDPDEDEDQSKDPERKKLKLKEVHLTKLLSTKVAVHSSVENLFKSIWETPHSRAPHAVKYFFDFLDAQADNMKILDPDVLHIWKTNSLPLRFWVNILKNPQFVFDMEKSPQLDGCLSVIAQAFMDSFSLSETQLGKHTPTNKLLYAKDVPKFKQEVKAYYKQIRDQPAITHSEFKGFLQEESKKHNSEFNEAAALQQLYKFVQRYFAEIKEKLNEDGAPPELTERLHHVKSLFDGLKSCAWS